MRFVLAFWLFLIALPVQAHDEAIPAKFLRVWNPLGKSLAGVGMTVYPQGKILYHVKTEKHALYMGLYRFLYAEGDKAYVLYYFNDRDHPIIEFQEWHYEVDPFKIKRPGQTPLYLGITSFECGLHVEDFILKPTIELKNMLVQKKCADNVPPYGDYGSHVTYIHRLQE